MNGSFRLVAFNLCAHRQLLTPNLSCYFYVWGAIYEKRGSDTTDIETSHNSAMSFLVTGFLSISLPLLAFLCALYNKSWIFTSVLVLLMPLFYFTIVLLSILLYVVA